VKTDATTVYLEIDAGPRYAPGGVPRHAGLDVRGDLLKGWKMFPLYSSPRHPNGHDHDQHNGAYCKYGRRIDEYQRGGPIEVIAQTPAAKKERPPYAG
jgi:hypothetical protein